jgi:hypothetical protein
VTPLEVKFSELLVEIETQSRRLVPSYGRVRQLALELVGLIVQQLKVMGEAFDGEKPDRPH